MTFTAHTIVSWLYRHRWLALCGCIAFTVPAINQLRQLQVSHDLSAWFVGNAPELSAYREFIEDFGSGEIVVVAFYDPDGLTSERRLAQLDDVTVLLQMLDGVDSVTTFDTVPKNLRSIKKRLYSDDGTTITAIIQLSAQLSVQHSATNDMAEQRGRVLADIRETLTKTMTPLGIDYKVAGIGVLFTALNEEAGQKSQHLVLISYLVLLALLWWFLKKSSSVLITLASVSVALIWVMGLFAFFERSLTLVTLALPSLVIVMGVADCVHILRAVAQQPTDLRREDRIVNGMAKVLPPCLITTITTAASFLSLTATPIPAIQDLGLFAAIGVIAAFVTAFVVSCWALHWRQCEPRAPKMDRFQGLALRLAGIGVRSPRTTIFIFAGIASLAAVGACRLTVDTNSMDFLFSDHPVRQDSEFIEQHVGPYVPLEFVIRDAKRDSANALLAPDTLQAILQWQDRAEAHTSAGWSWSLATLLAPDPDSGQKMFETQQLHQQLAFYQNISPGVINSLLSDRGDLRVTFGIPMQSAGSLQVLTENILATSNLPAHVNVRPAGYLPLYSAMVDQLLQAQLISLGIALAIIIVVLGLWLKSWSSLLLAIPGNLFPLLVTLGFMGAAGIHLDLATVTIATIVLGLVVDDSVHLLFYRQQGRAVGKDNRKAMLAAIKRAGPAIMITSAVLVASFSVLAFAQIKSIIWFGLLTSLALVAALLADLMLLPALSLVTHQKEFLHKLNPLNKSLAKRFHLNGTQHWRNR